MKRITHMAVASPRGGSIERRKIMHDDVKIIQIMPAGGWSLVPPGGWPEDRAGGAA